MKKIYLDNNIIIEIEQGNLEVTTLLDTLGLSEAKVFFSSAHLREAGEIKGEDLQQKSERLNKRFDTISAITKDNYLHMNLSDNKIYETVSTPLEVFNTINEVSTDDIIKNFLNLTSEEHKTILRNAIGIDMKRINNYSVSEVIEQLSEKHTTLNNMSMLQVIESSINFYPNSDKIGDYSRFVGTFEFIDLLGYWKDKKSDKSNYARFCDSTHCYYASYCDLLICNDKKMRRKSKVMYSFFDFDTKIVNEQNIFI